jgi:hypothetical protein
LSIERTSSRRRQRRDDARKIERMARRCSEASRCYGLPRREGLLVDRTSEMGRWPWRKWLLAGTAMAGSATVVGPVAVEGYGCARTCASGAECPCLCDACAATGPCAGIDPDLEPDAQRESATEDVTVKQACAAIDACLALEPDAQRDGATEDVTVDQAAGAPSTTDGNVDGGDTGAPDGHEDAPPEE